MPEGDTLHKLAKALQLRLQGQTIRLTHLRGVPPRTPLPGGRVESVTAEGKHLLIRFADEEGVAQVLRTHLGLWGGWHQYAPGEAWRKPARQAWVVLQTDGAVFVCFNAREVEVMSATGVRRQGLMARLGPDLLGAEVDLAALPARAREILPGEAPLVDVLLDQRIASGIGNVYKSELLFLLGLAPLTPLEAVSDETLVAAYALARDLLSRNLGYGPRTTRFESDGRGHLWVYGRRDAPCLKCGSAIHYARLGRDQRGTYWCPNCQGNAGM
ncbi:DNA-formamidopyrimidine glycosylase family protein [Thioalkalivibrio sulfidiphilus]|uniref:DNA-formamidopyrimidine glycosylase family protein n=1 Tax=Thioalkalivibrio sulfidiphilus TaxID=1033854 RepID=UPI00036F3519|nr:DNA-formamidopyrimidine glycosylase family protein [Thioalkalivibrio sulfidiphilus]